MSNAVIILELGNVEYSNNIGFSTAEDVLNSLKIGRTMFERAKTTFGNDTYTYKIYVTFIGYMHNKSYDSLVNITEFIEEIDSIIKEFSLLVKALNE